MKVIIALSAVFLINSAANASDFILTVYFNLGVAEKHGIVKCSQGGEELNTEYHLTVFKDKPSYTLLGNLDFDKNVTGDVERKSLCDEGEFTLLKSVHSDDDFINLFIYLEEIYLIKDKIFDVANIELSAEEDYFLQKKYISESGEFIVKTIRAEKIITLNAENALKHEGELVYRVELKRK